LVLEHALLTGVGVIEGAGINNQATVVPGISQGGVLHITGDYHQSSAGVTRFDVWGTPASGRFGKLDVGGTATLNGAAQTVFRDGFQPLVDMTYDVVEYGAVQGNYTSYPLVNASSGVTASPVYRTDRLSLTLGSGAQFSPPAPSSPLKPSSPTTPSTVDGDGESGAAAIPPVIQPRLHSYDPLYNKLISTVDELGRMTHIRVDPLTGNVLSITRKVGENAAPASTERFADLPENVNDLIVVDLDRDGRMDLVYVTGAAATEGGVFVQYGDARGEYSSPETILAGGRLGGLRAADLDGDGDLDLLASRGEIAVADPTLRVIRNLGSRIYSTPTQVSAQGELFGFELFDLEGDGDLDLALGEEVETLGASWGALAVHVNDGGGAFSLHSRYDYTGQHAFLVQLRAADLDGDGDADLAAITRVGGIEGVAGQLLWLENQVGGSLTPHELGDQVTAQKSLLVDDVDGDGRVDLVAAGRRVDVNSSFTAADLGSAIVWRNLGGGQFTRKEFELDPRLADAALVDLNADDLPDLVSLHQALDETSPSSLSVRFNRGNLEFTPAARLTENYNSSIIVVADVDGDVAPDLVTVAEDDHGLQMRLEFLNTQFGREGDVDDHITRLDYSPRGQMTSNVDALGRVSEYEYDLHGRLTVSIEAAGTDVQATTRYEYDEAGNMTAIIDALGHRTEYEFDVMDRVTLVRDALGGETRYRYDEAGNMVELIDALGHSTLYRYDARDRLIEVEDALGQKTRYEYDRKGNLLRTIDPLEHVTTQQYDRRDRVVRTIDPDGGVVEYEYDLDDNLIALTDPVGNRTQFVYDARDRQIAEIDPLGHAIQYEYDAVDNLIRKTDRNLRVTEYSYDELDRMTTELWVGGDNTIEYQYDLVGNLLTAHDRFSSLTYTYDAQNRMVIADNEGTPDAPRAILVYTHDSAGNVTSVTDTIDGVPGATTGYVYDELHRLAVLTQISADSDLDLLAIAEKRVDFLYNAIGQFQAVSRFADLNGALLVAESRYNYDQLNRLDYMQYVNRDGTELGFFDYEYDAAGRVSRLTDIDGLTEYSYDGSAQLAFAEHSDSSVSDELYTYDKNGNRIGSHIHERNYEIDSSNRLTSDGVYEYVYDVEGNLVRRIDMATGIYREFVWDHRNRLVKIVSVGDALGEGYAIDYRYDIINRRVEKLVNVDESGGVHESRIRVIYDREDAIYKVSEQLGIGRLTEEGLVRYLHGSGVDELIAWDVVGEGLDWSLTDRLGTHRAVIRDGGVSSRVKLDSFGNAVDGDLESVGYSGLAGREYDSESGLHFYRSRYYDSSVGRFLSEDLLRYRGHDTNLYRFVGNRPVSAVDPFGLETCDECVSESMRRCGNIEWLTWVVSIPGFGGLSGVIGMKDSDGSEITCQSNAKNACKGKCIEMPTPVQSPYDRSGLDYPFCEEGIKEPYRRPNPTPAPTPTPSPRPTPDSFFEGDELKKFE
jgi:RHS repeat-associated protein